MQNTEIQTQLAQIEAAKQALLEQQKELERQSRYHEEIAARDKWMDAKLTMYDAHNASIGQLFNTLSADPEVATHIALTTNTITERYPSYAAERLAEADRPAPLELRKLTISTTWGTIYSVGRDGKAELPYGISTRSQAVKPETIIKKIKEKIAADAHQKQHVRELAAAVERVTTQLRTQYPDAQFAVSFREATSTASATMLLDVTFANTSRVKLRIWSDASYGIIERHDHRTANLKGDALIAYLAS